MNCASNSHTAMTHLHKFTLDTHKKKRTTHLGPEKIANGKKRQNYRLKGLQIKSHAEKSVQT